MTQKRLVFLFLSTLSSSLFLFICTNTLRSVLIWKVLVLGKNDTSTQKVLVIESNSTLYMVLCDCSFTSGANTLFTRPLERALRQLLLYILGYCLSLSDLNFCLCFFELIVPNFYYLIFFFFFKFIFFNFKLVDIKRSSDFRSRT